MRSTWTLPAVLAVAGLAAGAVAQSKLAGPKQDAAEAQAAPLSANTPIPFHGRLTDGSGNAITVQTSLTFSLYKAPTGGAVIWSEVQSVAPQDGWFSVVLGDAESGGTVFPDWDGSPLWLGITVLGDVEMTPRTPLLPVPYAAVANPTQHAQTHAFGGTDQIGSSLSMSNELVRANDAGTIDPGWLPMASSGMPGVVTLNIPDGGSSGVVTGSDPRLSDRRTPLAHAVTHLAGGSDPLTSTSAVANGVPQANGAGQLDFNWLPTSATGAANKVPASSSGTLDLSWLPTSSTAASGAVPVSSGGALDLSWLPASTTASANKLPLGAAGTGKLDPSWLPGETTTGGVAQYTPVAHASTHEFGGSDPVGSSAPGTAAAHNAVPYADSNGYLDSWINQLSVAHGGTGTGTPTNTRNLCFFIAGPSTSTNVPTLMVPPGATSCQATAMFASAPAAPGTAVTYTISRLTPSAGALFNSVSWSTGQASTGTTGSTAVSAYDVLQPTFSGGPISNATVCVQLTCALAFH